MKRNAAWAIAIALGAAGLGLERAPAALAPAVSCPGLLDWAAIVSAQVAHSAPLGVWLVRADRVIFFVAIVLSGRAAIAASGSWLAGSAVTLAFAASPLFAPAMSPLDVAVPALASLAALVALDDSIGSVTSGRAVALCAVAIALAIPLVRFPNWIIPPLPPAANGAAGAACITAPGRAGILAALSSIGPYAVLLAVFGLFTIRWRLADRRAWPAAAFVFFALAVASVSTANPLRALAPVAIAVWLLAGAGLAEAARAAGPTPAGRAGALLLAALLPLVPIAARYRQPRQEPVAAARFGHDQTTLDAVRRTIQLLPDKSVVIVEEAATGLLLRAAHATWQRSGKLLRVVDVQPAPVASAAAEPGWHVFAWPLAQTTLPLLGFRLADAQLPGVSGVAVVGNGGVCADIGEAWRPIDFAAGAPMLVIRSEEPAQEGAVAIWVGSERPIALMPFGWPVWVMPGFLAVPYAAGEHDRVMADAAADGLTGREPVFGQPHVVRLEVWKVPDAPRLMPILLGVDPPEVGLMHATPGVTLQACPGYVPDVQPIALSK